MCRGNDPNSRLLVVGENTHGNPSELWSNTILAQPELSHASVPVWVAGVVFKPRSVGVLAERRSDGRIELAEMGSRDDVE